MERDRDLFKEAQQQEGVNTSAKDTFK